jgi:general secretion pathway protein E
MGAARGAAVQARGRPAGGVAHQGDVAPDIAEKRLPQDGRISLRIAGRAVDVRVSTILSGHGERVVLRILDKQAGRADLGSPRHGFAHPVADGRSDPQAPRDPLVTGPTGSGKTTTLYAALERLNDNTQNIMTVEDPIEYYIDGIRPDAGQHQGGDDLRARPARHPAPGPDVVLIGEIRDLETAQIAVQASLTRHRCLDPAH